MPSNDKRTSRSVAVIINSAAGAEETQQKVAALHAAFFENSLEAEFFLMHPGTPINLVVEKALESSHNIIVAAGGDGTINGIAVHLVNSDRVLGIIPMGTFNHLAKDLGIPLILADAVGVLARGIEKRIDVAKVNDLVFLNNSSIGIYSKLVRYREENQKGGWSKRWANVSAALSALWRYSFMKVEIEVNGQKRTYKTPLVFVGNNEYQVEGWSLGSRTKLDGGKLCVYIAKHSGPLGLITLAMHALKKTLRGHDRFDAYSATTAQIRINKRFLRVALDGEITSLESPLTYSINPKSLRVIVPA